MAVHYVNNGEKGLSYSRIQKLSCARYFEILYILGYESDEDKPHFSYGHLVAAFVQNYFKLRKTMPDLSEKEVQNLAMLSSFPEWSWPDYDGNEKELKKKRSLWHAIYAFRMFCKEIADPNSRFHDISNDYEVAMVKNRFGDVIPAVELEFLIELRDGYTYEGHVDLILQHKETGEMIVWEGKTTSLNQLHPAMYKNSLQALGYTIVTDHIAVNENRSTAMYVDYFVYINKLQEWQHLRFPKSLSLRSDFLATLDTQIDLIETMKERKTFPRNGDKCFDFFSPCPAYNVCHASNKSIQLLAKKDRGIDEKRKAEMDFIFTMDDITRTQIALAESRNLIPAVNENIGDGEIITLD